MRVSYEVSVVSILEKIDYVIMGLPLICLVCTVLGKALCWQLQENMALLQVTLIEYSHLPQGDHSQESTAQ